MPRPLLHDQISMAGIARRELVDPDWFIQNSTYYIIIASSVLVSIALICFYFLWRGAHRSKFPCSPSRRPASPVPTIATHSRSTSSLPVAGDGKIAAAPPSATKTSWADASRKSQRHLADLERNWEVKGKRGDVGEASPGMVGSRKIRKPRPRSPMMPVSAHTFGHGRSPVQAAHALSTAQTVSSFGHTPDQQQYSSTPPLPQNTHQACHTPQSSEFGVTPSADAHTLKSVIALTAMYPQPTFDSSAGTPYTPYSPPSAYPATPPTAYLPSLGDDAIHSSPSHRYKQSAGRSTRLSHVEYIAQSPASSTSSSAFDFSRPAQSQSHGSPQRQTAYSTMSMYSQATATPPSLSSQMYAYPQPARNSSLPDLRPLSPFTPFPSLILGPTPSSSDRPSHSPPQSILRKSVDSSKAADASGITPVTLTAEAVEVPMVSVTPPPLGRVKRASYAASRMSVKSSKPPPSPLRQIIA